MSRADDSIFMQALPFGVVLILNRSHGAAPFGCCVGSSVAPNFGHAVSDLLGLEHFDRPPERSQQADRRFVPDNQAR